jgi:hypothetical protein
VLLRRGMRQTTTLVQQLPPITFRWNGEVHTRRARLVPEEEVPLMHRRVVARKKHANHTGILVGMAIDNVYSMTIYYVQREEDGKIIWSTRITPVD